jgi:hypothetical protein
MTLKWILFGNVGTLRGRIETAIWKWSGRFLSKKKPSAIDTLDPTKWAPVPTIRLVLDETAGGKREYRIPMPAEYSVTGTPRHTPWPIRKKELEAASRQKRRQLESFREEA